MKRDRVLEETRRGLAKTGFFLSRPHGERGLCFDFVARRDDTLLIVKILQNVDALNKETAHELLEVARILEASPLVVGERSGTGSLANSWKRACRRSCIPHRAGCTSGWMPTHFDDFVRSDRCPSGPSRISRASRAARSRCTLKGCPRRWRSRCDSRSS